MGLGESDTRAKLIDPALHARGWTEDLIRREETAGAIEIVDGKPRKRAKGRTDYTLRVKVSDIAQPVALAIFEAKAEDFPPGHGLEQGKCYATCKRFDVRFVFASNGHLFVEFDRFSGKTSDPKPLTELPTPTDLRARYEQGMGFALDSPAARPLLMRYVGGEATRRYYQDAAIRAVLEKLAIGSKRALLTLATGSGKTFIAVHLLKRIADAGHLRRALFICDRDELRSQGLGAFQNVFGNDVAEAYRDADGTNHARNARIHIATYQTLDVDTESGTANFLTTFYPENYFSHIVIDECHRSAWGKWSQVLIRNPDAVQIGLTATPRKLEIAEKSKEAEADLQLTADNIKHFGEPVYEYDMAQGIEDGYLAACEIQRFDLSAEGKDEKREGLVREDLRGKKLTDATTGQLIGLDKAHPHYTATNMDDILRSPERVAVMTSQLFAHLLTTGGPEQKTIIFCARDQHADRVANALNNLYADWCARGGSPSPATGMNPRWEGRRPRRLNKETDGGDAVPPNRDGFTPGWSPSPATESAEWTARTPSLPSSSIQGGSPSPATAGGTPSTVSSSDGGDAVPPKKRCEPYAFKCTASVGGADYIADLRGASRSHFIATTVDLLTTGVDVPCVRNIVFFKYVRSPIAFYQMIGRGTRLDAPTGKLMFRVYDFTDATRLFGDEFKSKWQPPKREGPQPPPPPEPIIQVEGLKVEVSDAGRYIVTQVDGKAMPITVEEYKERLAAQLVAEAPTLDTFRAAWIEPWQRQHLIGKLPDAGRSALLVQQLENMSDFDLYDVLAEVGYGLAPRTRVERSAAFGYKNAAWLASLPPTAAATLKAMAAQFTRAGTDSLENPEIFQTPEVRNAGGLAALRALGQPADVLQETKERMFAA
ncbi:MAG: DEAD/DEAH box helicase family protein [Kiritimatiellaeota bacterium]|nr:DEAD/DEAH box helicase family protein [Kiritimatiellota bacterium]